MSANYQLNNNQEKRHFYIEVGDKVAYIQYIENPEKTFLVHTEVPVGLEGQGIGSTLVKLVLEKLKKEGTPVVPLCPFVAGYIKKHPEWKEIVAPGINIG